MTAISCVGCGKVDARTSACGLYCLDCLEAGPSVYESRFRRRIEATAPPDSVRQMTKAELLAIVRCSGNDPYTHTPLERQAWRELALRGGIR